jgi:F0F1-type ATP synthase gamma subunit
MQKELSASTTEAPGDITKELLDIVGGAEALR